ncbi:AraC family transcriptional regulator [Bacillus niameyensis]|uniref:AraC family transcriptional regulator n=1 Tax=Bacillus niameyensis TaxID=1522308 RepID=UPI000781ED96|nr:AraC family transcriptional regulator [Bacillus niameyensis]
MERSQLFVDGSHFLNEHATQINGTNTSILVHYWGAQSSHYNNLPHQHSFFELCYIVGGKGQYIEQDQSFPLMGGTLFLSRPYIQHQIVSKDGIDIVFVAFELIENQSSQEFRDLFNNLKNTKNFYMNHAENSTVAHLWTSLLIMSTDSYPALNNWIQGLCSSFYASVLGQFNEQLKKRAPSNEHSSYPTLIHQAKLYIRDNLSQQLRLDHIANYIHISSRHLSRIFKAELGQSFSSYVRAERIRKANLLLSETDLSIKEISDIVGFDTVHYFTSVFTKEMGMAPGQFRQKMKQHLG